MELTYVIKFSLLVIFNLELPFVCCAKGTSISALYSIWPEFTFDVLIDYHPYTHISSYESEVTQSCLTLCDPMDCSLLGSSVHGIFQARIPEWDAISFSRGSSRPKD